MLRLRLIDLDWRASIKVEFASETRPNAERLDPEKLAAASPSTYRYVRLEALKALIQIRAGKR